MMMLVVLVGGALADTITLDSGAALEGTLTHYEIRGTCNIHVDDGGLSGVDVVLPCTRVIRMERSATAQSAVVPDGSMLVVPDAPEDVAPEEELAPLAELAPMTVGADLAGADVGAEPSAAPEAALPVAPAPEGETPVAAVSPEEPPAPVTEEPVAQEPVAKDAPAAPDKAGPFSSITWPKIRIER
jgi:hypothetical protein